MRTARYVCGCGSSFAAWRPFYEHNLSCRADRQKEAAPMQILARFEGQSVVIQTPAGETIRVLYMGPNGRDPKLVNLGVEAPPACQVLRREWAER